MGMVMACLRFFGSLCLRLEQRMPSRLRILKAMGKNTSVSTGTAPIGSWPSDIDSGTWMTDFDCWMPNSEDGFSLFSTARSPDVCYCYDYALSENDDGSVQDLLMENQRLHLEIVRVTEEIKESTAAWLATKTAISDALRFFNCFLPPDSASADPHSRTRLRVQGTIDHQVACMRDFFGYFVHPDKVGAPLPHFTGDQS
ncbi:hypothetical protein C2845_PM01G36000 [Panicum miliaceum]|uniref:Uncharacterized protein n=1 Tax=Panicum miliaceum TaxID=4540 RepID=A0A3L6TRA4_PANMI|nr:hypothetical protein C2845_PM01G36000 [Panicum miliaceum]